MNDLRRSILSFALAGALAAGQLAAGALPSQAQDLTPEQRAEYRAKAETASRLVAYGQKSKDGAMLRAAAALIAEVGPVASEVKDGKPVNYDVGALLEEAKTYEAASPTANLSAASPTQCSWFYNCDSYNNCFWDQWC